LVTAWRADEEGFDPDPILAVKAPRLDQRSVPDLSENEVRRLLKACDGPELRDKRDKAMLTMLAETGVRAAELLSLDVVETTNPTPGLTIGGALRKCLVVVQWWCWHHLNYGCRHCFRISLARLTIMRTGIAYQAQHLPEAAHRPQIRRHHGIART
jgi:hypothetical protein